MENTKWVTVWGNAISIAERRPENYAKNLTLRYPVRMTAKGSEIRITLDNFCGNEAVTLTCGNIARSAGGDSIDAETIVPLSFGGCPEVTIPAGERVVSDPVTFSAEKGEDIAVSLYFGGFTEMRSGVVVTGPLSRGYFAVGNQTENAALEMNTSKRTSTFYFLSDIEVLTTEEQHTVVCFGDSITAQAWPDFLIAKTLQEGDGRTVIVRKAASGTRILRQYDNITYDSYGLKGETRFAREVLISGADTVIIQHGINDIIHPVGVEVNRFRPWSELPTAEDMIKGLQFYIRTAKAAGMKVYLGTLLPIKGWRTYSHYRDKLRNEVNHWIRINNEADGCIDFDTALRNPDDHAAFGEGYDSGDHLHPSLKAYEKMAEKAFDRLFE